MKKEYFTVHVIFKKDIESDEIIAFMPYQITNKNGNFLCYTHMDQHASCDYGYYLDCKPVKIDDYKNLLNELKDEGYDDVNIKIIKRINRKKYQKAYNDYLSLHNC